MSRASVLIAATRNPTTWKASVRDCRNGYSADQFVWHIESPYGMSLWEDGRGFSVIADIDVDGLDVEPASVEIESRHYASPQAAIDDLFRKIKAVSSPFRVVEEKLKTMVSQGSGV